MADSATVTEASATSAALGKSSIALRIVLTAERLFAIHGIDGVSLRQIAAEAGSGNNSAVHYHFGSKDALIAAIFEHRLPQLNSERRLLAARCDPRDLRSRLEAHYLPMFNLAEEPDNLYVSFVEQLQRQQVADTSAIASLRLLPEEGRRQRAAIRNDLDGLLANLHPELRAMRIAQVESMCLHLAGDRERARAAGAVVPPFELFVASVLDGVTAYLAAPSTDRTR
jgi:AcrR family transcriptional regulator